MNYTSFEFMYQGKLRTVRFKSFNKARRRAKSQGVTVLSEFIGNYHGKGDRIITHTI